MNKILFVVLMILISATSYAAYTDSLTAYYTFEEGSGTNVIDRASGISNGTTVNTPTWVNGKLGTYGMKFVKTSSQYVTIPDASRLDFSTNFTIAYWINYTTVAGTVMDKGYSTGNGNNPYRAGDMDATAEKFGSYSTGYSGGWKNINYNTFNTNTWHYVILQFNVSHITLWKDDVQVGQIVFGYNVPAGVLPLTIGTYGYDGGNYADFLNGVLDEVALWNRTLTDSERTGLYNSGAGLSLLNSITISISNLNVSNIGLTSASVTWSASQTSNSSLTYGLCPSYTGTSLSNSSTGTSFNYSLTGLNDNANYCVNATSYYNSTVYNSSQINFTTLKRNIIISGLAVNNIGFNDANVTWSASLTSNSSLTYGICPVYTTFSLSNATNDTSFFYNLSSLTDNTNYCVNATSFYNASLYNSSQVNFTTLENLNKPCGNKSFYIKYNASSMTSGSLYDDLAFNIKLISSRIYCMFNISYWVSYPTNASDSVMCAYDGHNISLYADGIMANTSTYVDASLLGTKYLGRNSTGNYYNGTIADFFKYNSTKSYIDYLKIYNQYSASTDKLGDLNSAMNFSGNDYVVTSNITGINSTSFWYKNQTDVNWTSVINVSGTLYVNGLLSTPSIYPVNVTGKQVFVGMTSAGLFNGSVDELMIFNYALSANEVFILANGFSPLNWINVTDCNSDLSNSFLTYTIYDERNESALSLNGTIIEEYVEMASVTDPTKRYSFSISKNSNSLSLCLPNEIFNISDFIYNATARFYSTDYVVRYDYLESQSVTANNNISVTLYDLPIASSTNFILTYTDQNNIPVDGAIIDVLRQYINHENQFISVENSKTDALGQALIHLEVNDVIYKFNVWKNGVLLYSSDQGKALCQSTPCVINLKNPFSSPSNQSLQNLAYSMTTQAQLTSSGHVQFGYSTIDMLSHNVNLTVAASNYLVNDTLCTQEVTASSGLLDCAIPPQYANTSLFAQVYYDGDLFGIRQYTLTPSAADNAGDSGIFMTIILVLSLGGIAISSPMIAIVLSVLAVIFATMIMIFQGGSIFGIGSSIIFLICAAVIIVWKLKNRRNG